MHHVEGGNLASSVAQEHRATVRVLDGIAPHLRVEIRHADSHHAVAPVPLRERLAEHTVELGNVVGVCPGGTVDLGEGSPTSGVRHQSLTSATARNSLSLSGAGSICETIEHPLSSSYRTPMTRSSPSRTCSTCVITITCSHRSCRPRSS